MWLRPFEWAGHAKDICILHFVGDNAKANGLMAKIVSGDPGLPSNALAPRLRQDKIGQVSETIW